MVKKIIALAVTEPSGGSDVSRILATAVVDPNDNDYYIINGEKYFITSGMKADYYTTAVKTSFNDNDNIRDSISLILIPRTIEGVFASRMKTQGWWCSNTAYITFKNVRIHKKMFISPFNQGWKMIMNNFNHERFMMATHTNSYSRLCLKHTILYASERKTFNKKLIEHQMIRHKIAEMIRKIETTHSLLENIAYLSNQPTNNKKEKENQERELSGIVAIAKVQATKTMEYCAREAIQVFGGRGYLRGGRGNVVERLYREVRVNAIGGGSEEILMDLAARQAKL